MKKLSFVVLAVVAVLASSIVFAEDWNPNMNAPLASAPADVANSLSTSIDVKPVEGGNRVEVTFYDVKVTPRGGGELLNPEVVRIASGILHAAKTSGKKVGSEYIAEQKCAGNMTFTLANFAKPIGVPVVEHLWGIGKVAGEPDVKYLVLNPDSEWVSYNTSGGVPDLETLVVGIIMCPSGNVMPLKSLGEGKLKQGKHPELADFCR